MATRGHTAEGDEITPDPRTLTVPNCRPIRGCNLSTPSRRLRHAPSCPCSPSCARSGVRVIVVHPLLPIPSGHVCRGWVTSLQSFASWPCGAIGRTCSGARGHHDCCRSRRALCVRREQGEDPQGLHPDLTRQMQKGSGCMVAKRGPATRSACRPQTNLPRRSLPEQPTHFMAPQAGPSRMGAFSDGPTSTGLGASWRRLAVAFGPPPDPARLLRRGLPIRQDTGHGPLAHGLTGCAAALCIWAANGPGGAVTGPRPGREVFVLAQDAGRVSLSPLPCRVLCAAPYGSAGKSPRRWRATIWRRGSGASTSTASPHM